MLRFAMVEREAKLGALKGQKVKVAQPIARGKITTRQFCEDIAARTSLQPKMVEGVIGVLHDVIKAFCEKGFIVECGELGNFRATFSSKQILASEDFSAAQHLRPARLTFKPNSDFRAALRAAGVEYDANYVVVPQKKGATAAASKPTPAAPSASAAGSASPKPAVGL